MLLDTSIQDSEGMNGLARPLKGFFCAAQLHCIRQFASHHHPRPHRLAVPCIGKRGAEAATTHAPGNACLFLTEMKTYHQTFRNVKLECHAMSI